MIQFPPSLPIPPEVLDIARTLEQAGHETWCVGGAVRDALMGEGNKDYDLATAAKPEEVQALFRRTIPIGIEHGTVAVLGRSRHPHEVTTFRRDVATDGRHAVVRFGASLDEDLARRDFTINAIAFHPLRLEWRDPFSGREDLERGIVRAVGTAAERFQEDYLRILRGVRFAGRYAFTIEPATWSAMVERSPGLQGLSAERVRDEWSRSLLSARKPSEVVRRWGDLGALAIWLPEVDASRADLVENLSSRDPVLVTTLLSVDAAPALARLRFPNVAIERGRALARLRGLRPVPGDRPSARRWMAEAGAAVDDLLALAGAEDPRWADAMRTSVAAVRASGAPLSLDALAITGDDLLAAGVIVGPEIGRTLRRLLEAVLDDPSRNTRKELLEMVKDAVMERRG